MRNAHHNGASIGEYVVDAVRDGDSRGIRPKVVIVDQAWGKIPARSGILERANQLALLGIHTDDGEPLALELFAQIAEVEELIVAVWTVAGGELLAIDPQRLAS